MHYMPRSSHNVNCRNRLLVNPGLAARLPLADTLWEPVSNFLVGGIDRIRSVADVAANFNAQITTNGSRITVGRHGGTKHLASSSDGTLSFPDHGADRSRTHVRNEAREKLLVLQVNVVLFHVLLAGFGQLHGSKLESLGFKSLDDFSNESSLDTIGL